MTVNFNYKDDVYSQNDVFKWIREQLLPVVNGAGGTGIEPSSLSTTQRTGFIPLDLAGVRIIASNDFQAETVVSTGGSEKASGGILASLGVIASINRVNGATDKAARMVLKANTTGEFQFPMIPIPFDWDSTADFSVNFFCEMAGATDTTTALTVGAFLGIGDTDAGGNTSADLTATPSVKSATIALADNVAYPNFLNVTFIPEAHANDAIWIYAAWILYTKKA